MKLITLSISLLLCLQLSGCGRIKAYFPDKERDYQLTQEIPALIVPADLKDNAIQVAPVITVKPTVYQAVTHAESDNQTTKDDIIYVDLVEYAGGATRIRIEDTLEHSWRLLGKALSRHSIEITDRNELDHMYFVQYDADFKKIEDGSLWDEILFIFASDPAKEQEFRIKLAENGALTEVIVLDGNDKPQSKGAGLKLLTLLYQSIKEDLAP